MFGAPRRPRSYEACLRDMKDKDAAVRADAAREMAPRAHGVCRGGALAALEAALEDSKAAVRAAAATALADAEAKESTTALTLATRDASPLVRQMALAALGEVGDDSVNDVLRAALTDEEAEVRFQAVIAYPRRVGAEAGGAALEAATRDADPLIAHIALRLAEELGEKAGEVDARLLRRAKAMLGHDAPLVRVAAAILLARGGEPGAEEVLVALVNGDITTGEGPDEAAAIELAGELGLEKARKGLEKRAFSGVLGAFGDRFRWHAKVALARLGDARARREITSELDAWDPTRRTLAVAAVGRARMRDAKAKLVDMRRDKRAHPDAIDEALRALGEES